MKKYLFTVLKIVLTVAAVCYTIHVVPFGQLVKTISNSNPFWLFLALLLFVASKYFSAKRVQFLFTQSHVQISDANNLRLYLLGMFYNLFLPGGVSGDGYKALLIQKQFGLDLKIAARILLADRLSGLAALGCCMVFIGVCIPAIPFRFYYLLALPFVYVAYFYLLKYILPSRNVFKEAEFYSFLVQLSQICSAIALLFSLEQHNSFLDYLFLFLLSSVVSVLPFTIGGLGARELTFVVASPWLGIDVTVAVSLGLLFYAITAFTSAFGILYVFEPEKLIQPCDGKFD